MAPEKHRPPSPLDKIHPQKDKEGTATCWRGPFFAFGSRIRRLALAAKGLNLLEEVVALVIYEDECREVFYCNLPDSLHTELRVLYALDALDRTLGENSSHAADSTEGETSVLLASLCYDITTVTLGNHDQTRTMLLERY